MSVVIRGMKMPKNCDECELNYDCFRCILPIEDSLLTGKDTENERLPNCPLIKLPAQHGRLIDADAFSDFIKEWVEDVPKDTAFWHILLLLGEAPTIIEAEGVSE